MLENARKDWMRALEDPCTRHGLNIDWELTEWSRGECLYFEHPCSPTRRGRIALDTEAYVVTYEVRVAHSRMDQTGVQALIERRFGSLRDSGGNIEAPLLVNGHRDIWGAEIWANAVDEEAAATWGRRLIEHAWDIIDTGRDGYVLDRLGIAFFREHFPLAQVLDDFVLGLHRRDWWGRKTLPDFPCFNGPGMAIFFDRHGRIVLRAMVGDGSLRRVIEQAYCPKTRNFDEASGVVESFWILPLRSNLAWRWGQYIDSWIDAHAEQFLMDPYNLDIE